MTENVPALSLDEAFALVYRESPGALHLYTGDPAGGDHRVGRHSEGYPCWCEKRVAAIEVVEAWRQGVTLETAGNVPFALNDEMYLWRADAERYLEGHRPIEAVNWCDTFAARVVWLVREMDRVVRERDAK